MSNGKAHYHLHLYSDTRASYVVDAAPSQAQRSIPLHVLDLTGEQIGAEEQDRGCRCSYVLLDGEAC
jgi:hypothetical protein